MLDFAFFITSLRKQETGIRSPSQLGEGNEALHAETFACCSKQIPDSAMEQSIF